jgi:3-phosphoshikimate 1-carboxyvinyltransferase
MSNAAEHPTLLRIEPRGPLDLTLAVPGSKSITNRALLVAALAAGESRLVGSLESDDTRAMREALTAMGVQILADRNAPGVWLVRGGDGRLSSPPAPLALGNAGTAVRFLTAACTLADGPVELDGNERMRERPIEDLVHALAALGAEIELLHSTGCPPVRVGGGGLPGGNVEIDATRSSQYVSAVLLAAPYAQRDVELRFRGGALVSRPYVDVTLEVMGAFGAEAAWLPDGAGLRVRSGHRYTGRHYAIEPDASSAAYPLCAAAIRGGRARVIGLPGRSRQSDLALLDLLERMGCRVVRGDDFVELVGPERGLASLGRVDMNELPDAVMAYAVVALFARGPTRIENVGNLRIKETDRLQALECELARLGARVRTGDDWIEIRPGPLHGAEIETYDDHRMAMAFALAGLRIPGVAIRDPDCVSKSWPGYFTSFERW